MSIKLAIIGVGNCSSALIQGINYYKHNNNSGNGLIYKEIGGYLPEDIRIVAAYDVDERKVGRDVGEAIFAKPNCTKRFFIDEITTKVQVRMGNILDGFSDHLKDFPEDVRCVVSNSIQPTKDDIVKHMKECDVDVLINYLPVGSDNATKFYAECALEAEVAFVNCVPVFIASNDIWGKRFKEKNIPIIGDDIKSQLGATIIHRALVTLFKKRGVKLEKTYQINTGGNTDFLNMLDRNRLVSKKISKTEAVQSVNGERIENQNIHIGPSDYIPWLKDNKVCFIRTQGNLFGDVPMELDIRLSVEDSPNSAGVAIDMIRFAKVAKNNNIGGVLIPPSAYYCKHPPFQYEDSVAYDLLNNYLDNMSEQ